MNERKREREKRERNNKTSERRLLARLRITKGKNRMIIKNCRSLNMVAESGVVGTVIPVVCVCVVWRRSVKRTEQPDTAAVCMTSEAEAEGDKRGRKRRTAAGKPWGASQHASLTRVLAIDSRSPACPTAFMGRTSNANLANDDFKKIIKPHQRETSAHVGTRVPCRGGRVRESGWMHAMAAGEVVALVHRQRREGQRDSGQTARNNDSLS